MLSKTIFTGLVTAALSIGCAAPQSTEPSATSKAKPSYAKPGAAVTFSAETKGRIDPGGTGHVVITMTEPHDAGVLTVNVTSDEALQVFATSSQQTFAMDSADSHIMDVYFTAAAAGRQYLNFVATTDDGAGQTSSRVHTIAIQVGDPEGNVKPSSNVNIKTMDDGERLIIMDAEETIVGQGN